MDQPQVVAEPRHDLSLHDAVSGGARRFTVYTGSVWLAPPPQISNPGGRFRVVSSPDVEAMDPGRPLTLFLPDSLPYRNGAEVVVSATAAPIGAVDQVGADAWLLYPLVARLSPDPRGGDHSWIEVEVRGRGRLHAITYSVSVTAPVDAVG